VTKANLAWFEFAVCEVDGRRRFERKWEEEVAARWFRKVNEASITIRAKKRQGRSRGVNFDSIFLPVQQLTRTVATCSLSSS